MLNLAFASDEFLTLLGSPGIYSTFEGGWGDPDGFPPTLGIPVGGRLGDSGKYRGFEAGFGKKSFF